MTDILVNKTLQTIDAFNAEFRYLQPDNNHTMFYVKRSDNTIFPFKGYAFSNDNIMRVKAFVADGKWAWVLVRPQDEVYFTTNVINITAFQTVVTEISSSYTSTPTPSGSTTNIAIIYS